MKREGFPSAAESAIHAIDDRYSLVARGILYGIGAVPLYVGVYIGGDRYSYKLAAASAADPNDNSLHVIDVRCDVYTANGFQGATNVRKAPNRKGELEEVVLFLPKDTNVFIPNDPQEEIRIGTRALVTDVFKDN